MPIFSNNVFNIGENNTASSAANIYSNKKLSEVKKAQQIIFIKKKNGVSHRKTLCDI